MGDQARTAINGNPGEHDLFHLQQVTRMLADLGAVHREQEGRVWIEGFEPGPYLSDRQAAAVCRALDALDEYGNPREADRG